MINAIPKSILESAQPAHLDNVTCAGILPKRGVACAFEFVESNATPQAVSYLMGITSARPAGGSAGGCLEGKSRSRLAGGTREARHQQAIDSERAGAQGRFSRRSGACSGTAGMQE